MIHISRPVFSIFIIVSVLLSSCSQNETLHIVFERTSLLLFGAEVQNHGHQIGAVSAIGLTADEKNCLVTITLNDGVQIPVGSTFEIIELGVLGEPAVDVKMSSSRTYYTSQDRPEGISLPRKTEEQGLIFQPTTEPDSTTIEFDPFEGYEKVEIETH